MRHAVPTPRHHLALALILGTTALFTAGPSLAGSSQQEPDVRVLDSTKDYTLISVTMPDFTLEEVKIDGIDYYKPVMPGTTASKANPGDPDLPELVRSLRIPGDAHMKVSIADMTTTSIPDILIAPNRGAIDRDYDPRDVPYFFGDTYQKPNFYPESPATLGEPWIMRNTRGVDLRISPFMYSPTEKELRFVQSITIKVTQDGPAVANALTEQVLRSSRLGFREMYGQVFLNWDIWEETPICPLGIEMLVIAPEDWLDEVQPLVDHRNAEGIITASRSIESIGNTPAQIRDHIKSEYLLPNFGFYGNDLTYVLLVGDDSQITTNTMTWKGDIGGLDPEYGYILGSDQRPEVFIGRFPAASATEATLMVDRTLAYEGQVDNFSPHRTRALGIASNDGDGSDADENELDWVHLNNIRTDLLASTYTDIAQVYDPTGTNAAAIAAVENGVGLINYTGHGLKNRWTTTGFDSNDVNGLNNKSMWPWIISVACDVGRFNSGSCFAEAWLRATTDDGEAAGAVAAFMSTINQNWAPPMEGQDVINAHEAAGTLPRMGPRCASGTNSMITAYPTAGPRNAKTWHLFGDPALRLMPRKLSLIPFDWPLIRVYPNMDPLPPITMLVEVQDQLPRDVEFLWNSPWIDVYPSQLTLMPGEIKEITVTIDETALGQMDLGEHLASIVLFDRTTGDASNACVARGEVEEAPCQSDFDGDGMVAVEDLLVLISQWGPCTNDCEADTDGNGFVDLNDLLNMLAEFGPC